MTTLDLATMVLAAAVAMGSAAAVLSLRARGSPSPLALALGHAILALGGYALLLAALGGPQRGAVSGVQSFGAVAAVLIGLAVLAGLALLRQRRRRQRISGALIGIHATLAVSGFVILVVYALLP
jgi:MYXO-CTERM domain-containing protein